MKSFTFSLALALATTATGAAADTIRCDGGDSCVAIGTAVTAKGDDVLEKADTATSKYDKRVHRYRRQWESLIPTQTVIQYAGNMGMLSAGMGWEYGRRKQWETHLLFGVLPKYRSSRTKMTMTLKENFIPWSLYVKNGWAVEPLSCGIYFNTVFGHEFWRKQPGRYPENYYQYMSSKIRINVFVGQRVEYELPQNKRKFVKSVTAFYEVSTCDIYIRQAVKDCHMGFLEIFGLSLGLKFQIF